MSSCFISCARLRMTNISTEGIGRENFFIEDAFAFVICGNCMLKHFDRRQIGPVIRVIRLILNSCYGADELHDPWRVWLQDVWVLCSISKSSEEEVRNIDWPRHAEVVKYVLHDANYFFS